MKLQLSFVPRPWRWQLVAGAAGVACVLLLGAAALLALHYLELGEQHSLAQRRLERVAAQLRAQPPVELPADAEREQLRIKVASLNAQGAPKGWTTAQLLLWLEEHMPSDVRLVSLHHKARDGEAVLVAESGSPGTLTAFLQELERDPAFSEVLLAKQGGRAGDDNFVRFEIHLTLRA